MHFYFSLFYIFRETICNVIDDVHMYKEVIGNKPECMNTLFVMYNRHAYYKKIHIFIVVGILFDFCFSFIQADRGNYVNHFRCLLKFLWNCSAAVDLWVNSDIYLPHLSLTNYESVCNRKTNKNQRKNLKYNSLQTFESCLYIFKLIHFSKELKLQATAIIYSSLLTCTLRKTIPLEMMQ